MEVSPSVFNAVNIFTSYHNSESLVFSEEAEVYTLF